MSTIAKRTVIVITGLFVLAIMIAAATGGGNKTATATTPATTQPASAPDPDSDGDGVADSLDYAPHDPKVSVDPGNSTSGQSDSSSDETESSEPAPEAKQGQLGRWATDDRVAFRVVSFEQASYIPPKDEYSDGVGPRAGGKLYKVVVSWKNNTGVPQDLFCGMTDFVVLIDQDGNNYTPTDDSNIDLNNGPCGEDVQPGEVQTVTLAYRVPRRAQATSMKLWNKDADDGSTASQPGSTYIEVGLAGWSR